MTKRGSGWGTGGMKESGKERLKSTIMRVPYPPLRGPPSPLRIMSPLFHGLILPCALPQNPFDFLPHTLYDRRKTKEGLL